MAENFKIRTKPHLQLQLKPRRESLRAIESREYRDFGIELLCSIEAIRSATNAAQNESFRQRLAVQMDHPFDTDNVFKGFTSRLLSLRAQK